MSVRSSLLRFATASLLVTALLPSHAADRAITGLWKVYDDKSTRPQALIRLNIVKGELRGTIEKSFVHENGSDRCNGCPDEFAGKPVVGLTILYGLRQEGDEWVGGYILDTTSGEIYRARLKPGSNARTLEVRGYIGRPVLGRTAVWQRAD